ncbi:unnamed protein product [Paramecium sonneborni]|uniref:VWFA domain-containing protein n=1 Tax=Paramecium sonneborni TaxID=65129 RepID=A0A8S1PBQ7_9CILI|nr:unnamed protein product [Paramecium sonneborni]
MENKNSRLYGILIDVSGSMKESYDKIQDKQQSGIQGNKIKESRLQSVWNLVQKAIQEKNLEDDYLFASAFGCKDKDAEIVDLIPLLAEEMIQWKQLKERFSDQFKNLEEFDQNQNQDYHQLLYSLVKNKGACNIQAYYQLENLRNDIPKFKAKLIYIGFKKKESLLINFITQLPEQVKRRQVRSEDVDQNFKRLSKILFWTIKVGTVGFVDYDMVNDKITTQLRNLDNHIDYKYFFDEIHYQLTQIINQLSNNKDGLDQMIQENLEKIRIKINEINNPNFNNSLKYLELEKICDQFSSEQIIDKNNLKVPEKINLVSLKNLTGILKNKQNIINSEDENKIFKKIKQISYGQTPMRKCLELTLNNNYSNFNNKFLFIISDGQSTDGDPRQKAQRLKDLGFLIICFYISTSHQIDDNQLFFEAQDQWDDGAKNMFEMSSEVSNFEYPLISIGQHTNIKLSQKGRSRLFLQGNNPKQMQNFFDYFMKLKNEQDTLLNLIGKVQLEKYINGSKKLKVEQQIGKNFFANPIAAVYQLVMIKIYNREGGYPDYNQIREEVIRINGENEGNTFKIIQKSCSSFRLQCRELKNINDIKLCLHQGRPLIAKFKLCEDQWFSEDPNQLGFYNFFKKFGQGILTKIRKRSDKPVIGHAVVLHKYTPEYYSFINSWGTEWGDAGFFKIKDLDVLGKMRFMEVFWTKDNLTEYEKESFKQDAGQKITNYYKNYFSIIGNEVYTCPKCLMKAFINEYKGNYYEAQCPKCQEKFHPQSLGELFIDYLYGNQL